MKQSGILNIAIMIFAVLLIALAFYVILMPPQEITLKDITPAITRNSSPNGPSLQEINPVDSSITDGDVKVQVEYYIIVQSNRNLRQAQQKAEELTNKYNTNFIVLPRTKEGFYRISYGKYSKLEEVNSIIKGIRTNIRSDAWILSLPAQEGL
jgi:hypothetical protein